MMLRSTQLRQYLAILVIVWSAGILASLSWNIFHLGQSITDLARASAGIALEKDVLYRKWASGHGGVYVPVTKTSVPNPFLKVPERDVTTSEGLKLTLVNPAYMTRQANELALSLNSLSGHITSLKPIRPGNDPDPWEAKCLESFERGVPESVTIESSSGKEVYRLMRPFLTEESCLKCHADQGYRVGDVRGGISVSIPMEPLRAVERSRQRQLTLAHAFLWMFGLAGIGLGSGRLRRQMLERKKNEEELLAMSITDSLTGLHNRRGFLALAEHQIKLSNRTKKDALLFVADLDGLKQINDTLGHEAGDRALIEVAAALRKAFRSSDIIARMGGDEFAVLAIETTEASVDLHRKRLRESLGSGDHPNGLKDGPSLSIGHSLYDPENPCSIDELMARADLRMYEQKKDRRDRSVR